MAVSWFDSHTFRSVPGSIGGFYLGVGLLLWKRSSRWSQGLAIVAWIPLFAVKPFSVAPVIRALLEDDPNYTPPRPTTPPPEASTREGRVNLICRVLTGHWVSTSGLASWQFIQRCSRDCARESHGRSRLHRDYCFAVSADNGDRVDSVKDLLLLLEQRHPYAAMS
jgi:hypothetical protein